MEGQTIKPWKAMDFDAKSFDAKSIRSEVTSAGTEFWKNAGPGAIELHFKTSDGDASVMSRPSYLQYKFLQVFLWTQIPSLVTNPTLCAPTTYPIPPKLVNYSLPHSTKARQLLSTPSPPNGHYPIPPIRH